MTAPVLDHVKHGGRILRRGDQVKVRGLRGLFRITRFYDRTPVEVEVYGGPTGGVRMYRTITVDRVGVRKALAGEVLK